MEAGPIFLREIVSIMSHKYNNSTNCENESINNFQLCKKRQLLTETCIVNVG